MYLLGGTHNPRNPVAVYQVYSKARPRTFMGSKTPMYLGINYKVKDGKKVDPYDPQLVPEKWFKNCGLGVNIIAVIMKTMIKDAVFKIKDGPKVANHSARKTLVQNLK